MIRGIYDTPIHRFSHVDWVALTRIMFIIAQWFWWNWIVCTAFTHTKEGEAIQQRIKKNRKRNSAHKRSLALSSGKNVKNISCCCWFLFFSRLIVCGLGKLTPKKTEFKENFRNCIFPRWIYGAEHGKYTKIISIRSEGRNWFGSWQQNFVTFLW